MKRGNSFILFKEKNIPVKIRLHFAFFNAFLHCLFCSSKYSPPPLFVRTNFVCQITHQINIREEFQKIWAEEALSFAGWRGIASTREDLKEKAPNFGTSRKSRDGKRRLRHHHTNIHHFCNNENCFVKMNHVTRILR